MNILFLTIGSMENIENKGIYTDLLRQFKDNGHNIYTVSPYEKRKGLKTVLIEQNGFSMLHVKIGNITTCGIIEKGISTVLIESQFISAIKKYFRNIRFDLVIYSTPPITFANVISYIKKRDGAKSYLLLKDIFPQNAVDMGMMTKSGLKSAIYKFFRKKEEKLYKLSDYIGCMSQANVDFVINNNSFIDPDKVHVNPNSIEVIDYNKDTIKKKEIYAKYNIPEDAVTFIYGGNLGRPQDIPFIIECLKANADKSDRYFVICGTGTEYPKLKAYVDECRPQNVLLLNGLPKAEYEDFVKAFEVGLIFLDHRFTIPNFPSRLLSYMQAKMPVLACTDINTDIGKVIENGNFGWWCESKDPNQFTEAVNRAISLDLESLGNNGYEYLKKNYTVQHSYNIVSECIKELNDNIMV